MKRGKRQVIDREPESAQGDSQQYQGEKNHFHLPQTYGLRPEQTQPNTDHLNQNYHTQQQVETQPTEVKATSESADEKKKKLEMLKLKYLKKSKPQDAKPQSEIIQNLSQVNGNQTNTVDLKVQSQVLEPPQPKVQIIKPSKPQVIVQSVPAYKYPEEKRTFEPKLAQVPKQQVSGPIIEEVKKIQIPSKIHEVPKPPVKAHGRNAPPPPPIKKSIPVPTPVNTQNEQVTFKQPVKVYNEDDQLSKKTLPLPIKQQLKNQSGEKTQRSDNVSFAPPSSSLDGNQMSKIQRKDSQNVPPPPPLVNNNMREILNKKLSKNVPKPPSRVPPPKVTNDFDTEQNSVSPNETPLQKEVKRVNPSSKQVNTQIDDQYTGTGSGYEGISNGYHSKKPATHASYQQVDASKYVGEWMGSPQMALKELFPNLKETIQFYCLNKNLPINIKSNNQGFTPLIGEIIQSFILNNGIKYSSQQKRVTQSICLKFFYQSATELSDVFLVLLVKMGDEYLHKYEKVLEDKLESYLSKLVFYKNLLLPQEISGFVGFCIQRGLAKQSNFLEFLMLSDNPQLINLINNTQMQELINKLGLLSLCKLNLKNRNVIMLYLKLISSIEVELGRNQLVEKVLNHLKELDIPQNLYQYTKQLKLKLLKSYQNSGGAHSENNTYQKGTEIHQHQPSHSNNNTQASKDSGLFGYFNLNKAIDKIKTTTQKALERAIQKPKKVQEQQKKDNIVYDPIRKRYIINGQIPQDQNQVDPATTTQVKPKVPPPPPLGGKKAPPPLHNKKPGPRIQGNNRYV